MSDKPILFDPTQGQKGVFKQWRRNGELHNDAGPALIEEDGTETYYRHGVIHRPEADGPAITKPDGTQIFVVHGHTIKTVLLKKTRNS